MTTRVVAVVPFVAQVEGGNSAASERAGRWARQIARRLVDRSEDEKAFELRPVLLVAMPGAPTDPGYLIFGAAPDARQAAEYGRSLGVTHVLGGVYREHGDARELAVDLFDVAGERVAAAFREPIPRDRLQEIEPALSRWLAGELGGSAVDLAACDASTEDAYAALLEGMDLEVDAAVLRSGDEAAAERAVVEAASRYARAAHADPDAGLAEERLLVIGAGAAEREDHRMLVPAFEELIGSRPRSWRAHYMLGEMRRLSGDTGGAIVAFEHADAIQQLRAVDQLTLAQLHITAGAPAVAASRLRRIVRAKADTGVAATARRLLLGIQHPDLERELEAAGRMAVDGDPARAGEAAAGFERVLAAEPDIWEAHFGRGLLAWQSGDAGAAQAAFDRALELNPAAADLLADLGRSPNN